ncbi:hypothetical protein GQ44DRAFT_624177, partial [Phaeosphaeriaceae sp. PMI808]
ADPAGHINVKGSKKLLTKSHKPASTTISSPPKAAIAASNAKKEEGSRRRHPLNDILRRRSGDGITGRKDGSPPLREIEPENASRFSHASRADAQVRVEELERALKSAKGEQDALRQELEKVKQTMPEIRDTNDERRLQCDQTLDDAPRASSVPSSEDLIDVEYLDSPSRANTSVKAVEPPQDHSTLDQSNDDIVRQNYRLRFRLAQLQDQLTSQEITHRNELDQASLHGDEEWNELRLRLHATEKESQERLHQLFALKSSISSLTRSDSQVTDSELSDSFSQLSNRIREWVISHFRRTKFDIVDLALMQIFEEPIIVGLPQSGVLAAIRSFARGIQSDRSEYCEWRRATIHAIEKSDARRLLEEGKRDLLYQIAGEITHILFALTSVTLTPLAQSTLMGILNIAADLQRTLALQRAKYQLLFFRRQDNDTETGFDDQKMESVNVPDDIDDDDNDLTHHFFLFCVFPCLEKFGNEWGENAEVVNILLKAKVCCGVG